MALINIRMIRLNLKNFYEKLIYQDKKLIKRIKLSRNEFIAEKGVE